MSFNGSGTFTRTNGTYTGSSVWANDRDASTKITAANHDTHDQDLADGLTACITKSGVSTPTANIPFGGFRVTNLGNATARTDGIVAGQVQDAGVIYGGTSGGSANAQTLTLTPAITAYTNGMLIRFKAGFTNTDVATLNVNSVGATNIQRSDGSSIKTNDLVANQIYDVIYNSTGPKFVLLPQATGFVSWSPSYTPQAGVLTSTTTTLAEYKLQDDHCFINLQFNTTPTVAAPTYIDVTNLPWNVRSSGANQDKIVYATGGATDYIAVARFTDNSTTLRLFITSSVPMTVATVWTFRVWQYYNRKGT